MAPFALQAPPANVVQVPKPEASEVAALLEAIVPPSDLRFSTDDLSREWHRHALKAQMQVRQKIEQLEKDQRKSVDALKRDRPRMEADLRVPEVMELRSLIDDPAFHAVLNTYQDKRAALLEHLASPREDERRWMAAMGGFFQQSAQDNLNSNGRPFETTTVRIPGTGPSAELLAQFNEAYLPIWGPMKKALIDYEARVAAAEARARKAAPGPTADAAARIIRIRLLRWVYNSAEVHLKLLYPR